jgi:hypothetical protein
MLNDAARQAVEAATFGRAGTFRRPLGPARGFAGLPATVEYLLTGDEAAAARGLAPDVLGGLPRRYDTVVLILADAFGWRLFQRFAEALPFLRRFLEHGVVSPLTAQFPSTTAAHLTTLHTGLPAGASGVHEWYYYEPAVDAVIAPLLFSFAGDHQRETLLKAGVRGADLFPTATLYQRLSRAGVACTIFQDYAYAHTTYSNVMFDGARVYPYATVNEALARLAQALLGETAHKKRYYVLYLDGIDSKGHRFGPHAPDFAAEVEAIFTALEKLLYEKVKGGLDDALLILTADHGVVGLDPAKTRYVNWEVPGIERYLRINRQGEPIQFAGSSRDLFLYAKDECLRELEEILSAVFAGQAEIWRTEELIAAGFFGDGPLEALRARVGNLVVLPYAGGAVFWYERGRFAMRHRGSHGGLTPEEMETGAYLLAL